MADLISVSAIKDSLTECPICTEPFDENSRIPRRMPCCVQSICQPCLETYSRGRQTLSCPMCRHRHHLPGGVNSLPKEPLILKILDHLKIQKGLRLPCTECPDNHTAIAQCDNCGIFLCTECLNAHIRNRVTKNHTTVTFEEVKGRPVESFRHLHQCTDHQQQLQFYCHTCQKVICVSCTVVEHDKGKGHKVVSLDEAHREKSDATDEILTKLDEKALKLNMLVKELQGKRKNIQISKQKAKEDINTCFDDLIEEVQKRRALLLSEADQKCEEDLKVTDATDELASTLLTKVRSSTEYTRKMRCKADKMEDLQLMTSSAHSLNTMLEESPQYVQFVRKGVCFVPAYIKQLTSLIKAAGLMRKVTYLKAERPDGVPETECYNSMTLDPAEFGEDGSLPNNSLSNINPGSPTVNDMQVQIPFLVDRMVAGQITCPLLEWDKNTAGGDVTVSGSEVTTNNPTTLKDTGCRMEASRHVLTSRSLVIREGQRVLYNMKVNFSLRKVVEGKRMIFELSATNTPIDAEKSQISGLGIFVVTCSKHKQQLCLKVRYDNKTVSDVPLCANGNDVSRNLHLCVLMDGNNNKIDIVDVDSVKVLSSVTDVVFGGPIWIMMHVGSSPYLDVKGELISGINLSVSENMRKFLSASCHEYQCI